jgi:hypothetical protein
MAWRGSWKAVPLALATFSLVVALGLAVFGLETYRTWLDTLASADWSWVPMNASLRAPITRALTVNPAFPHFADAPALAALVWRITFVVLATLVLALAAFDRRDGWRDRGMALLLVSAVFPLAARLDLLRVVGRSRRSLRCCCRTLDRRRATHCSPRRP